MPVDFDDVNLLETTEVKPGEKWLYAADFNVDEPIDGACARIDCELDDIAYLVRSGASVAILAHKGRHKDGSATDLGFVCDYLSSELSAAVDRHVAVHYFPENVGDNALAFIWAIGPGSVAVMGNTRMHAGEEAGDDVLAERFADLGDKVAVGGFGKAHRKHASNHTILESIPGYLTKSQQREMEQLNFWAGNSDRYSVAVLGGIKKEKITDGLVGLAKNYDVIIPGGIVLNTILKVMGMEVGDSILQDSGKSFEGQVAEVLNEYGSKICVPNTVIVYNPGTGKSDSLSVDQGVPEGYRIVDYELPIEGLCALRKVRKDRGRLLVAGTPGLYKEGFTSATDVVLNTMHAMQTGAIVLGGDTAKELDYHRFSTGGGSALYFVSHGTTPVFEALKMNKQRFNV